jgi:hypothetical protein
MMDVPFIAVAVAVVGVDGVDGVVGEEDDDSQSPGRAGTP